MNDLLAGIGIFVLGIVLTIGSIWLIQQYYNRRTEKATSKSKFAVLPEEYLIEALFNLPALLSEENIYEIIKELQNRYHLTEVEADEKLTAVIRSNSFERVTGARCTCFAESKKYGKYFHAPSCEYRKFLEDR